MGKFKVGATLVILFAFGLAHAVAMRIAASDGTVTTQEAALAFHNVTTGGLLFLVPGLCLSVIGHREVNRTKRVVEFALMLNRKDGRIDVGKLVSGLGLSELTVREALNIARQKRLIPFEAELV